MKNIRKRIKCEAVTNKKRRSKLISSPCYEYINITNEEVVVIRSKQIEVELKKPIYFRFTILDLSKELMYEFHYNIIKKQYEDEARLLFTDTDSLMLGGERIISPFKSSTKYSCIELFHR